MTLFVAKINMGQPILYSSAPRLLLLPHLMYFNAAWPFHRTVAMPAPPCAPTNSCRRRRIRFRADRRALSRCPDIVAKCGSVRIQQLMVSCVSQLPIAPLHPLFRSPCCGSWPVLLLFYKCVYGRSRLPTVDSRLSHELGSAAAASRR